TVVVLDRQDELEAVLLEELTTCLLGVVPSDPTAVCAIRERAVLRPTLLLHESAYLRLALREELLSVEHREDFAIWPKHAMEVVDHAVHHSLFDVVQHTVTAHTIDRTGVERNRIRLLEHCTDSVADHDAAGVRRASACEPDIARNDIDKEHARTTAQHRTG